MLIDIKEIEGKLKENITSIKQINYGYTNKIYDINNKYILKICIKESNRKNFIRASNFCYKYYGEINCPKILLRNINENEEYLWQLEEKIQGQNLFFIWSKLTIIEKESVIKQICDAMKKIHSIQISEVFDKDLEKGDWKEKFYNDINKRIIKLKENGIIYDIYDGIQIYLDKNLKYLNDTNYCLCHSDIQFDNIIIDNNIIVTILDYDRLRIASIDYELDIINRLSKYPLTIANDKAKEHIEQDDYKNILGIFNKYYPEMFEVDNLNKRLSIYEIKHWLSMLGFVENREFIINILNNIVNEP